jgi:hypothetical protein
MEKRIVYTRFDGGVSICCPAKEAIAWMTNGGFDLWNKLPRGFAEFQIRETDCAWHPGGCICTLWEGRNVGRLYDRGSAGNHQRPRLRAYHDRTQIIAGVFNGIHGNMSWVNPKIPEK